MREKDERGFWGSLWREALQATTLGWDLALPIFAGVLIGHVLDRRLDTGLTFTLGLLVFGVFVGYYNLWRFIQKISKNKQPKPEKEKGETETD